MKNMDAIILNLKQKSFGYNFRKKDSCPLKRKCLTPKVIYDADVSSETNNNQKFFFALAKATFKEL